MALAGTEKAINMALSLAGLFNYARSRMGSIKPMSFFRMPCRVCTRLPNGGRHRHSARKRRTIAAMRCLSKEGSK
jgi:hypothetical protein